ncbi:MAG: alpha/beta hydrolase [Candidatus Acidiferrales bacterium]
MRIQMLKQTLCSLLGAALAIACGIAFVASAATAKDKKPAERSGFITTSDGVKIHYLEAGRLATTPTAQVGNPMPSEMVIKKGEIGLAAAHQFPSILFVPGWTMPAWIWQSQIDYFAHDYRVVAMDPRSQGQSSQTSDGLYPAVRARDIKAVVDQLHLAPVVIVAWSMAVVETMAYVDQFGTNDFAGLILVDNGAGGRAPGDADQDFGLLKGILEDRKQSANAFIRNLNFKKPHPEDYLNKLVQASLQVPTNTAVTLLVGYYVADYRSVLPKIDKPVVVCAAKSSYMSTIVAMQKSIPGSKLEIFDGDGHALFVDDPDKFNALVEDFLVGLR